MYYKEDDDEFKINIYDWKDSDKVDVEIDTGYGYPKEYNFESVKEAREFIKKLKSSKVYKYKVNEDGSVELC